MNRTSTPCSPPERGQVEDLVVVDVALHDGVDLDGAEPDLLGRLDAVEHAVQLVTPGHLEEALAIERIEADVEPIEPRRAQ